MPTAEFSPALSIEAAYRAAISRLVTSWIPVRLKDMSPEHWLRELSSVSTRKAVIDASTKVAVHMVTRVNVSNVRSWRQAAYKAQGGPQIYHLLQEELRGPVGNATRDFVSDTARYLSNIHRDVARDLLKDISEAQSRGIRHEALVDLLKLRFPQVVNSKIKMLARTGVSSTSTALTRARSNYLGLPAFVWESSEDQRVRPSHRAMNGVVILWDDLPSPELLFRHKGNLGKYAPGDCPNCRCYPRPILTLEDIFSSKISRVKLYGKGSIKTVTRSELYKLTGIESRIAA